MDATCEHYLDVCCGGGDDGQVPASTPQPTPVQPDVGPVTPSQPDTVPLTLPGCGVRNDGGIDFTVTDVDPKYAGFGEFPVR